MSVCTDIKGKTLPEKNNLVPTLFVEMLVVLFVGNFAFFPFRRDLAAKWNPFLMLFFCARVHHCEKKFQVCKDQKYLNYQRTKKNYISIKTLLFWLLQHNKLPNIRFKNDIELLSDNHKLQLYNIPKSNTLEYFMAKKLVNIPIQTI